MYRQPGPSNILVASRSKLLRALPGLPRLSDADVTHGSLTRSRAKPAAIGEYDRPSRLVWEMLDPRRCADEGLRKSLLRLSDIVLSDNDGGAERGVGAVLGREIGFGKGRQVPGSDPSGSASVVRLLLGDEFAGLLAGQL